MATYHQVQVVQEEFFDCLNLEDEGTAIRQSNEDLLTQ
jgi:hypothetical protein